MLRKIKKFALELNEVNSGCYVFKVVIISSLYQIKDPYQLALIGTISKCAKMKEQFDRMVKYQLVAVESSVHKSLKTCLS